LIFGENRDGFFVVLGQMIQVELAGQHQPCQAARITRFLPR
jgi:hypothetical protein